MERQGSQVPEEGAAAGSRDAAPPITRAGIVYWLGLNVSRLFFALFFWRRVLGRERVPREGGLVVAFNHQSFLDIPLVALACPRHVSFVARESLRRSRFVGFLIHYTGAVAVRRGAVDRAALREMVEHLRRGDVVCLFPEGTRSSDGTVQEFRRGALVAARMAGVPILPGAIRGTIDAWPRGRKFPRPHRVQLEFGQLVDSKAEDALDQVRAQIVQRTADGRLGDERAH